MKLRLKTKPTHRDRLYMSLSYCGFVDGSPHVCCSESSLPSELIQDEDDFGDELNKIIDKLSVIAPAQEISKRY